MLPETPVIDNASRLESAVDEGPPVSQYCVCDRNGRKAKLPMSNKGFIVRVVLNNCVIYRIYLDNIEAYSVKDSLLQPSFTMLGE
jgi:hypothetical protein